MVGGKAAEWGGEVAHRQRPAARACPDLARGEQAEVAGADARAGVEVDALRFVAEVGAESDGGVVDGEFTHTGQAQPPQQVVQIIEVAAGADLLETALEADRPAAKGDGPDAPLVGEHFAVRPRGHRREFDGLGERPRAAEVGIAAFEAGVIAPLVVRDESGEFVVVHLGIIMRRYTEVMACRWSRWRAFPDPRRGGALVAPIGAGVYELRHGGTGELILLGIGRSCAQRMASLLPEPWGVGGRRNAAKRRYVWRHLEEIEYRTRPCCTRTEAAGVERKMLAERAYRFGT